MTVTPTATKPGGPAVARLRVSIRVALDVANSLDALPERLATLGREDHLDDGLRDRLHDCRTKLLAVAGTMRAAVGDLDNSLADWQRAQAHDDES